MNKKTIRILTFSKKTGSCKKPDFWVADKNDNITRLFEFKYAKITILLK